MPYFALLQFNIEFLANLGLAQEISSRKNTEIAVFLNYLTVFFVNLGILSITGDITFIRRSKFLFNIKPDLLQIVWFQWFTGSFSQFFTAPAEDLISVWGQNLKLPLCEEVLESLRRVVPWGLGRNPILMPGNRDPLLSPLPSISGMAVIVYRVIVKFIRYEKLC